MKRLQLLDDLIKHLNQYEEGRVFLDELESRIDTKATSKEAFITLLLQQMKLKAPALSRHADEAMIYYHIIAIPSFIATPIGLLFGLLGVCVASSALLLMSLCLLLPVLALATTVLPELTQRKNVGRPLDRFMSSMGYKFDGLDYHLDDGLMNNYLWSISAREPREAAESMDHSEDFFICLNKHMKTGFYICFKFILNGV